MEKFGLLADHLKGIGLLTSTNTYRPGPCKREWLELVHCPSYIDRFIHNQWTKSELRRLNLPWSEGLVKRSLISPAGTLLTAQLAMHSGIACHLAGGTHHAHFDYASGFCIFNDLAITAKVLLQSQAINRVLIFDCDVHQGDGTAALLAEEPQVFTCSIHCGKNFPFTKQLSDCDIELDDGIEDALYLSIVEDTLRQMISDFKPQIVLYDAGVDVYQHDPLGRANVSIMGIQQRDRFVLEYLKSQHIPVATVIGGGYDDNRQALAERHSIVVQEAARLV